MCSPFIIIYPQGAKSILEHLEEVGAGRVKVLLYLFNFFFFFIFFVNASFALLQISNLFLHKNFVL